MSFPFRRKTYWTWFMVKRIKLKPEPSAEERQRTGVDSSVCCVVLRRAGGIWPITWQDTEDSDRHEGEHVIGVKTAFE